MGEVPPRCVVSAPLVSVIIPAYNAADYILYAIESLRNQTISDFECIIIDDCSTDATLAVAQRFADCDSRFRVFSNERNLGAAQSRNSGVSRARGRYIAFLDADDCYLGDKLEKQLELLRTRGVRMVCCAYELIDENGTPCGVISHASGRITYKRLLRENIIGCSSVLIESDLIKAHPFPSGVFHEDYACWLDCLKDCSEAYGLDEPLVRYRFMRGTKSNNKLRSLRGVYEIYRRHCKMGLLKAWGMMLIYVFNKAKKYSALIARRS